MHYYNIRLITYISQLIDPNTTYYKLFLMLRIIIHLYRYNFYIIIIHIILYTLDMIHIYIHIGILSLPK